MLRSISGSGRYGLRKLDAKNFELVRSHNLIALRCCMALDVMASLGRSGILEQPAMRPNEISMLLLDEYVSLLTKPGVTHTIGTQWPFGALARKQTSLLAINISLDDFPTRCPHAVVPWYQATTGEVVHARHAPSKGTAQFFRTKLEAAS